MRAVGFGLLPRFMGAVRLVTIGMRTFWRQSRQDRLLLLEAAVWLTIASFAIAVLPFRHVGSLAAMRIRRSEASRQMRLTEARRIRWAILVCARRVPWRAMCFQQGLAAQIMLRRRGVPSRLHYGAASDEQRGLSAHVWVRDGDVNVIGGEIAYRFALLVTFPPHEERS
jgi:Transglutaminase-like superfamily